MEPEGSLPHSQLHPVRTPTFYFLKIHLNIILPSTPGSPRWSFPSGFPSKTMNTLLLSPIRATCPAPLILLNFITRTLFGEQYRPLSALLCSFLHYPLTSSLLGQNILLNALFWNTLSLRSSLNASDQVLHPYTTTGRIIVLYILFFKFLDSKLADKGFHWKDFAVLKLSYHVQWRKYKYHNCVGRK